MALAISQHIWVGVGLIGVLLITLAVELLNTAIVKDLGSAAVLCMLVLTAVVWGRALLECAGF
jgi:diacylglycerol kinase